MLFEDSNLIANSNQHISKFDQSGFIANGTVAGNDDCLVSNPEMDPEFRTVS